MWNRGSRDADDDVGSELLYFGVSVSVEVAGPGRKGVASPLSQARY
jgi:hypothetical protein